MSNVDATRYALGNCTNSVRQKLLLPPVEGGQDPASNSCSLLSIRGSISAGGVVIMGQNRRVCASASQVNLVTATVESSMDGVLSFSSTRLPSDLNYLKADFWEIQERGDDTYWYTYIPIQRYTLSDNHDGPTTHFIAQDSGFPTSLRQSGPGSGGNAMTRVGARVIQADSISGSGERSLALLGEVDKATLSNTSTLTRWGGQIGASYLLASVQYNGWVALQDDSRVLVTSQGGQSAICYNPVYALGFLPLVVAAVVVLGWFLVILITSSIRHLRHLGDLYGGMYPYWKSTRPDLTEHTTVMIWQKHPDNRLDFISSEDSISLDNRSIMAVDYISSDLDQVSILYDS